MSFASRLHGGQISLQVGDLVVEPSLGDTSPDLGARRKGAIVHGQGAEQSGWLPLRDGGDVDWLSWAGRGNDRGDGREGRTKTIVREIGLGHSVYRAGI